MPVEPNHRELVAESIAEPAQRCGGEGRQHAAVEAPWPPLSPQYLAYV